MSDGFAAFSHVGSEWVSMQCVNREREGNESRACT